MLKILNPKNRRYNRLVIGEYYLKPKKAQIVPLDDPDGEVCYFRGIRNALEEALLTGKIVKNTRIAHHIPDYVAELIDWPAAKELAVQKAIKETERDVFG